MEAGAFRIDAMPGKSTVILGVVAGIILSIASPLVQAVLPKDTLLEAVFRGIHWPEFFLLDRLTDWLSPGNRDQGMLFYMIIHPLYWMAVATGIVWIWDRRQKARA